MNLAGENGQARLSIFLFLVLCSLLAGGVYMLDRMELIDIREQIYPYIQEVPYAGDYLVPSPISKLERKQAQLRKMRQALNKKENQLETRRKKIQRRREKLKQQEQQLDQKEKQLRQREQALSERRARFQDKESRYEYLANLYSNMPPEAAAARLENIQQDRVVIAIFRRMENRNTSIILSNMDNQRAASLTRKMANYPG